MKKCFKCGELKEEIDFYRHPKMVDGRLGKCKECTKKDVGENYRNNINHYINYEKERSCNKERRERAIFYEGKRRKLSPDKFVATRKVSNAIRNGRLLRAPCEVCGSIANINAHHEDYSKPMEVRWLCWDHHMAAHGKVGHL